MYWNNLKDLVVKSNETVQIRPRYSLTNDIVGYRRCPRQYGFFNVCGYVPAHALQLFYGTIIHEVLDRAHRHFRGYENPKLVNTIPSDEEIQNYYLEVEHRLRMQGIKAHSRDLRDRALKLLKKFNRIEGPSLYPRVIDTEHRLQGNRETYIVEGVIDLLVDTNISPQSEGPPPPGELEIWDYKGTKFPKKNKADLENYKYQMLVYAALYQIRNGVYPKKAVLYFLNELDDEKVTSRPQNAILEINIRRDDIENALAEFDITALEIQKCKESNKWIPPPPKSLPLIEDTCAICDIRWSCSSYVKLKNPKITCP